MHDNIAIARYDMDYYVRFYIRETKKINPYNVRCTAAY